MARGEFAPGRPEAPRSHLGFASPDRTGFPKGTLHTIPLELVASFGMSQ